MGSKSRCTETLNHWSTLHPSKLPLQNLNGCRCSNVGMSTCFWFLIVKFNASRRETAKILAAACKEKATMYQLSYLVLATANKFDFESAKLFLSCRICVNTPW